MSCYVVFLNLWVVPNPFHSKLWYWRQRRLLTSYHKYFPSYYWSGMISWTLQAVHISGGDISLTLSETQLSRLVRTPRTLRSMLRRNVLRRTRMFHTRLVRSGSHTQSMHPWLCRTLSQLVSCRLEINRWWSINRPPPLLRQACFSILRIVD